VNGEKRGPRLGGWKQPERGDFEEQQPKRKIAGKAMKGNMREKV